MPTITIDGTPIATINPSGAELLLSLASQNLGAVRDLEIRLKKPQSEIAQLGASDEITKVINVFATELRLEFIKIHNVSR